MDISSRYLPDISDSSAMSEPTNASFQIPSNSGATADLLLTDESFFHGMNEALATPAIQHPPRRFQPPMTLEDLTPRSKRTRYTAALSSVKSRPNIPSPLKPQVTRDLSIALEEALSPLKPQDSTFSIPLSSVSHADLLAEEDSSFLRPAVADATFVEEEELENSRSAHEPLTFSQLTPGPSHWTNSPLNPLVPNSRLAISDSLPTENSVPAHDEPPRNHFNGDATESPEGTELPTSQYHELLAEATADVDIPLAVASTSPLLTMPDASGADVAAETHPKADSSATSRSQNPNFDIQPKDTSVLPEGKGLTKARLKPKHVSSPSLQFTPYRIMV